MTKKKKPIGNAVRLLFLFRCYFFSVFFSRGLKPVFNADAQTATRQQQQRRQRLATTSLTTKQKKKRQKTETQQQKQIDNNVEVKIYKFCLRCRFFFDLFLEKKYRLTRETVSLLHLSLSLSPF